LIYKATYVCEMLTEDYWILYQFSYRMVGNILKERDGKAPDLGKVEVRCCHEPYPYGAPGFPEPHFDLEFWVKLPRVYQYGDLADFLMHGREIEFTYNQGSQVEKGKSDQYEKECKVYRNVGRSIDGEMVVYIRQGR